MNTRNPNTHELKCHEEFYEAVISGHKTFEIRKNDRGFQAGDLLLLRETDNKGIEYTGRFSEHLVTYMTTYNQNYNYVVMAIKPTNGE